MYNMDLDLVHQRTGISARKLRYCLDHNLIPGMEIHLAVDESGHLRQFNEFFGFMIVCATKLLEVHLPHKKIRLFFDGLLQIFNDHAPKDIAARAVLTKGLRFCAHFGDGANVRVEIGRPRYDSGWIAPGNPAKLDSGYTPTWTIMLDLGKVRDELWHS